MKKIISVLLLAMFVGGCTVDVRPRSGFSNYAPMHADACIERYDPYPIEWASNCDSDCCYYEFYSGGLVCEEAWCFDSYTCEWEYMGDVCY